MDILDYVNFSKMYEEFKNMVIHANSHDWLTDFKPKSVSKDLWKDCYELLQTLDQYTLLECDSTYDWAEDCVVFHLIHKENQNVVKMHFDLYKELCVFVEK